MEYHLELFYSRLEIKPQSLALSAEHGRTAAADTPDAGAPFSSTHSASPQSSNINSVPLSYKLKAETDWVVCQFFYLENIFMTSVVLLNQIQKGSFTVDTKRCKG